jgi:hypothetical protein
MLKCRYCKTELTRNSDYDISHEDGGYSMQIDLTCPKCRRKIIVYTRRRKNNGDGNSN